MPVTITVPDALVDAITERRGTDSIFDELAKLIDHGFHHANGDPVTVHPKYDYLVSPPTDLDRVAAIGIAPSNDAIAAHDPYFNERL